MDFLSYLLLMVLQTIFTKATTVQLNDRTIIQKCVPELTKNFLEIPATLRAPYPLDIIHKLEQTNNNSIDQIFNFTLTPAFGSCSNGSGSPGPILVLPVQNKYRLNPVQSQNKPLGFIYERTRRFFTAFGFLKSEGETFHPHNYCIVNATTESISVQLCIPRSTRSIPKCCPVGMVHSCDLKGESKGGPSKNSTCVPISSHDWEPLVHPTPVNGGESTQPNYKYRPLPSCPNGIVLTIQSVIGKDNTNTYQEIRIDETGSVSKRITGNHEWEKVTGNFCIDGFLDLTPSATEPKNEEEQNYRQNPVNQIIRSCREEDSGRAIYSGIYFGGIIVSCLFILMIVVVYGFVWFDLNINGWIIGLYCLCLLLYHIFLLTAYVYGYWGSGFSRSGVCVGNGILAQFFQIAHFSWLTVLNFDLWFTITSMKPRRSKDVKRFVCYAAFGFGIPSLVVFISLILETQFEIFDDRLIRPNYGLFNCEVDKSARMYYIQIPGMILFGCDIIFATLTLKHLWNWKHGMDTKFAKIRSTKKPTNEIRMFGKLLVVMGFSWIFELLPGQLASNWYITIFDLYNIFQSILLFWIFLWKKEIENSLTKKFPIIRDGLSWIQKSRDSIFSRTTSATPLTSTTSTTTAPE